MTDCNSLNPLPKNSMASAPDTIHMRDLQKEINGTPILGKIKRLREPSNSRLLSTAEEILLLKGSKLNGCKFPPWKSVPSDDDFLLKKGEDLFCDHHELHLSDQQCAILDGWKRPADALPPPSMRSSMDTVMSPIMDSTVPTDLVQDAASDCSVVASLCAESARVERGHPRILSLGFFPHNKHTKSPITSLNGKYVVRLNFNGCYRKVVIDDKLPVSKTDKILHVIDRNNPALLWPALLEKAYLKVRGGYDFPGSNSATDLWVLTGWIPEQILLQWRDPNARDVWKSLYNSFRYGDVMITIGTGKMDRHTEELNGLESEHDYAVLDMKETDHQKYLLLKNPWAAGTSSRSTKIPSSLEFTDTHKSSPKDSDQLVEKAPQGTFWVTMNEAFQLFESLYVNWNPGLFRFREDIHFAWRVSKDFSNTAFVDNPQFSIFGKAGEATWLLLCCHFEDAICFHTGDQATGTDLSVRGDTFGLISLYVFDTQGRRVYLREPSLQRVPHVNCGQTLLRFNPPSSSLYTVVVSGEDLESRSRNFTLSAFSESPSSLSHATQKYPFRTRITGAWASTTATAGGNPDSPIYSQNPQFRLVLRERADMALLLQTSVDSLPVHFKLLHGKGERVYAVRRIDIITDSGEHRHGSAYAELNAFLPAGKYTVICNTFQANREAEFSLMVDATSEVTLEPIPREGAGRSLMEIPGAHIGPGANRVAAPIIPKRIVRTNLVAKFKYASRPLWFDDSVQDDEVRTRSPLRMSLQLGRRAGKRILATSNQGEYADPENGVRIMDFDLDPAMLQHHDIWLVLERLSGTASGTDEHYNVQLFNSIPGAITTGAWCVWEDEW